MKTIAAVCLFLSFLGVSLGNASTKPGVVLIVADDLRADLTSAYGGPVKTPNLDKLAARGCLFTRATCGYPICHVSRTELITGRTMVAEAAAGKAIAIKSDWTVWPEVMRQAGWHTVYTGKWHVQGNPAMRGYEATSGFYSSGGGRGAPLTFPFSATGRAVTGYSGWTIKKPDNTAMPELGIGLTPETDRHIADGGIQAIRESTGKPLFLHLNFTAPHDPLHWPKGKEDRFKPADVMLPVNFLAQHPFDHGNSGGRDESIVPAPRGDEDVKRERAVYYAVMENLDAQTGRVLRALEEKGTLDRTLIIFTSDHGLALGSHGLMGKQNQYEHTANVPLIIAGPGVLQGQRSAVQCALRDLFPTICEMSSIPMPPGLHGRSLAPVLAGSKDEVHEAVFGYFTDTQRMIRKPDGWKLIWYPKAGRTQMFNTVDDPAELRDLATDAARKPRVEQMMGELKSWLRAQGDTLGADMPR